MKRAWRTWAVGIAAVGLFWWVCPPVQVVPLETRRPRWAGGPFDAEAFVGEFWERRLLPAAANAVRVEVLLDLLQVRPEEALERYGRRLGLSRSTCFLVSGEGTVVAVDDTAVSLALAPGGPVVVVMGLGPVFGNTLRDGSGLLDVNEFPNSQDFNAISAALNRRVEERVLPQLKAGAVPGRTVTFAGCVEIQDPRRDVPPLRVVPFLIRFP